MALNPAYASQSTRKLPFALGYVYGTGVQTNSIAGYDGSSVAMYLLGEGEWDGPVRFSPITGWPFIPISATDPATLTLPTSLKAYITQVPDYFHFHAGSYGTKGLPANLISLGPDQATDNWWQYFPAVTPVLTYSGMAYYVVRYLNDATGVVSNLPNGTLNPIGLWRSTRCRIFDESGDVVDYAFTVNPTWQMLETLLRYQIKPQQPPLAGLTNAERALFDWPAMAEHAARNAAVVTTGAPRFCGNFMFAADAKLGAIMETQLRNCRSYKRERNGVISFVGDDARASVYTVSQRAVVPGSLKIQQKDVSTAPNIVVAQYRDLGVPAVTAVSTVVGTGLVATFTTVGAQPFFSEDYFCYGGSADDAQFAGDWRVGLYIDQSSTAGAGTQEAPPIANQFIGSGGPAAAASTTGGYLGTQQSRFEERLCDVVQHRSHQAAFGQAAIGLSPILRRVKVNYDFGNNTFDQTNRLAQWIKIRDLGPDVSPYVPPNAGSISVYAENVDVNGNCAGEVEPGDVITLDETADPTFQGEYVVGNPVGDNPPQNTSSGGGKSSTRDFVLQQYQPTAYTDASTPPGNSYITVPNTALPTADIPVANANYIMQATPTGGLAADGTLTISLPDLTIWWAGQTAPTTYSGVQLTEIPANVHIILYLTITSLTGAAPVLSVDTKNTYPPVPLAAGVSVIFIGTPTALATAPATPQRPIAHVAGSGLTASALLPLENYIQGHAHRRAVDSLRPHNDYDLQWRKHDHIDHHRRRHNLRPTHVSAVRRRWPN